MQFKAQIHLHYQNSIVNAKSILGILALAITKGTKVSIHAQGIDAEQAVKAIISLAHKSFNIKY